MTFFACPPETKSARAPAAVEARRAHGARELDYPGIRLQA